MTPHIVIRTDADMGFGHVTRMRALAHALATRGASVSFLTVTKALPDLVTPFPCTVTKGIPASTFIPSTIVVVDTTADDWATDRLALFQLNSAIPVVRIDHPTATRDSCSILILPNAHTAQHTLNDLGNAFEKDLLAGWNYVMLENEVTRQTPIPYKERAHSPIVFCAGASDPENHLDAMRTAAQNLLPDIPKIFAVGQQSQNVDSCFIHMTCNSHCTIQVFSRDLLRTASLVVTMMGQTVYECLYWGTPVVAYARTSYDAWALNTLASRTSALVAGGTWEAPARPLASALTGVTGLWEYPDIRTRMSQAAGQHIDGHGVERVADAILSLNKES